MKNSIKFSFFILITALLVVTIGFVGCAKEEEPKKVDEPIKLSMGAGISTGNYYNIGESLGVILKKPSIELTANETNGSLENVDLLLQNRADLGIAMLSVATEAYDRPKTSDAAIGTDLRVMMSLYPNVIQIITTEETGIKNFQDIKYKRIGISSEDSEAEWNTSAIFEAHGMSTNDCEIKGVSSQNVVTMLKNKDIDVAFIIGTVPSDMIAEVEKDKKQKLVIIPIAKEASESLIKKHPSFQKDIIPENSYGKNKEIETVSVMNMLLVNKRVSDKTVKKILTTIEGKLVELEASLGSGELVSLENPEKITEIPLHPGAKKYFEEKK